MSKKICLFSILFAIFLSGCGAKGAKFEHFVEPQNNNAVVYVYRQTSAMGALVRTTAYYDNGDGAKEIGTISNGAYAKVEIPANIQTKIYVGIPEWGETIVAKVGETLCFKYGLKENGTVFNGYTYVPIYTAFLYRVDLQTCKKEIVETQLHSK